MDKGAHFYKSDFQVHSPRDARWAGERPVKDSDRFQHATRFVQFCRQKGIQAIAVTDHHDVCFAKYYQLAAQDDLGSLDALDPGRQNPVVFPGVELALNDPCQAIVLLDATATVDVQNVLLQVLGLVPGHSDVAPKGPDVSVLPFGIEELDERLLHNEVLRGRYIILPHVGDSGHKTLLREGFHDKYRSMPCVGGYIEMDWATHGKKFILDGRIQHWGNKALGVFQTSDSRREDRSDCGTRCTWVKIAEPTAEALRQACLARESRIHQTQPSIPTRYIARLEVTDSTFMGTLDFGMNPQFNAIIGGRGTGKSTILEYARWAMQDQPVASEPMTDESDLAHSDGVGHRRQLIQETLRQAHGTVKVTWHVDGVNHIVKAASDTDRITLTVGGEPEREVTPDEIRELLPVTAYSQKQLSSVSIRRRELQRFIEQPIKNKLRDIEERIREQRNRARQAYAKVVRHKDLQTQLAATQTMHVSLRERVQVLQSGLPELTSEVSATISEHPARLRESEAVKHFITDLRNVGRALFDASNRVHAAPNGIKIEDSWPQSEALGRMAEKVGEVIRDAAEALSEARAKFASGCRSVHDLRNQWRVNANEYEKRYMEAQETSAEHKEKISQLAELRKQEASMHKKEMDLNYAMQQLGDVGAEFSDALKLWMDLHKKRGDILEEECGSLAEKSGASIRAELRRGADVDAALEKLQNLLTGARITTQNWESLTQTVLDGRAGIENWSELMLQLRPLAEMPADKVTEDFAPPEVKGWKLTDKQRTAVARKLTPEAWLEVALTSLKDVPAFYYSKGTQRIPFEKASAGEQATALLRVLLNDRGGPLIIDQPEDDLNKELTQEIVEELWKTKQTRQVIFASHDANLVVNGDAELILFCDYAAAGDRSRGAIKAQGAIDVQEMREAITRVMEGGKKAFELRRQKYGF